MPQSLSHRPHARVAASVLMLAATIAFPARSRADESKPLDSSSRTGTKRALLFCGLPGDDDHRKLYAKSLETIRKALVERLGFPASAVWVRFGTESKSGDGPALTSARDVATREGIEADVAELRKTLTPDDTLWVIVLGHGHFDGRHSHLNLPGPDLSDVAFGKLFAGLKAKEMVVIVTTSSSGFFLKPLSAPGRVVITATEADQEVNETIFPLALADTLTETPSEADRDKNGSLSLFELYLAVVDAVMKRYTDDELLPTEHARLDDNGDGHGSEPQLDYLPPELGGRPRKENAPPPTLGPKDDGSLASKIRLDLLAPPKPEDSKPVVKDDK